ncbi:hypothetical protein GH733_011965, partial [Mirounga leonina]
MNALRKDRVQPGLVEARGALRRAGGGGERCPARVKGRGAPGSRVPDAPVRWSPQIGSGWRAAESWEELGERRICGEGSLRGFVCEAPSVLAAVPFERLEDYRVNIFLRQKWNDPRLKLPSDFRGSDALTVDPTMYKCLWKPDLFFANEKSANFHDVTQENILLFIFRDGDVLVSMRLSITLSCPLDLTLFPMDTQLGYTTDDLRFIWQSGDPVQLEKIALPQFDIKKEDIEYGNCTKYYKGTGYYTCVEVIFTLRRQVGFYMMGVYAPTLLIVVLSWLSFWINPDASAARVPLGIFSVLSLASECTTLAAELPKVSYVKALDVWLIACLLFGFASLVEYAVVQVMLNNPKRVEAEKARIAKAEQADGKGGNAAKKNTVNGTGTPVHISTLQEFLTISSVDPGSCLAVFPCFSVFWATYIGCPLEIHLKKKKEFILFCLLVAIENENKNYLKCKTAGPGEKTLHRQQLAIRLLHSSRKSASLRLVQAGASERQLLRRHKGGTRRR